LKIAKNSVELTFNTLLISGILANINKLEAEYCATKTIKWIQNIVLGTRLITYAKDKT